ncbi:MAG: hypothetical protein LBS80_00915 [Tannerella sp.]|jgi:hypothetical protein|nr:hypothetical protein [Tannerella sp.]
MKQIVICFLLLIGTATTLHSQDKLVLISGKTIDVKVQQVLDDIVKYTYPGEIDMYQRPKSGIAYILYANGKKDTFDKNYRDKETGSSATASSRSSAATSRSSAESSRLSSDDGIPWQDVKTTFSEADVSKMKRLQRISAVSTVSYKDAVQQLKKKAAAIGGTIILIMDVPENAESSETEVMGIAYRDEASEYTPKTSNERTSTPVENSANARRRRIAQQLDSYNSEADIQPVQSTRSSSNSTSTRQQQSAAQRETAAESQTFDNDDSPDAVYLLSGRIIHGTIQEYDPEDFVSIRTPTGKVSEFSMDDVKRVVRGKGNQSAARAGSSKQQSGQRGSRQNYDDGYGNGAFTSGYKGTFNAGYNLAMGVAEKGSFGFHTSHGYQLNEYLYVGVGAGLNFNLPRDPTMQLDASTVKYIKDDRYQSVQGHFTPVDSLTYMYGADTMYMTVPIFLDVRGYLPMENLPITPFAMLRVGYTFNLSDGFGGMGLFVNPAIGASYQLTPRIGLNFSIGYMRQSLGVIKNGYRVGNDVYDLPKYGFYYEDATKSGQKLHNTATHGISLQLGVEF